NLEDLHARVQRGAYRAQPSRRVYIPKPVSAPASIWLSRLNSTAHTIAVYASQPPSPTTTQHSLPGARYGLPEPVFHRQDRASLLAHKKSKKIQARFLGLAWSGLVSAWRNFGLRRSASWHDNVGSSVAAFAPNTQESLAELPPTGRGGRPLRRRHRSTNAFSI